MYLGCPRMATPTLWKGFSPFRYHSWQCLTVLFVLQSWDRVSPSPYCGTLSSLHHTQQRSHHTHEYVTPQRLQEGWRTTAKLPQNQCMPHKYHRCPGPSCHPALVAELWRSGWSPDPVLSPSGRVSRRTSARAVVHGRCGREVCGTKHLPGLPPRLNAQRGAWLSLQAGKERGRKPRTVKWLNHKSPVIVRMGAQALLSSLTMGIL